MGSETIRHLASDVITVPATHAAQGKDTIANHTILEVFAVAPLFNQTLGIFGSGDCVLPTAAATTAKAIDLVVNAELGTDELDATKGKQGQDLALKAMQIPILIRP